MADTSSGTRVDICAACNRSFEQKRKSGRPQRYCLDPACKAARREAKRQRDLAAYHRNPSRTARTSKNWRESLPTEVRDLPTDDSRYRSARYAALRGVRTFTCQLPECGKEFERPNKQGHPPHYCCKEHSQEAARIRTRLWNELNPDRKAAWRSATKDERNRLYREAWAADAEFRNRTLANAIRRARRAGMSYEETRADSRAVKRLRFALARGSREGDLVTYEELYERDAGICQLCFTPVPFDEVTMDHTTPCSKGGPHVVANLVIAHAGCNSQKRDS